MSSDEAMLRDLLARYMQHVRECEGTDFVDRLNESLAGDGSSVVFAETEIAVLRETSKRVFDTIQEAVYPGDEDLSKYRPSLAPIDWGTKK